MFYRKFGRESCWEAIGPAREVFKQISEEIKIYLEKNSEPVPYPGVTWTIYMIGRSMDTARPTLLFCFKISKVRKQIRDQIKQSGILNSYPGVRIGDADRPPDFDYVIDLSLVKPDEVFPVDSTTNEQRNYSLLQGYQYSSLNSVDSNFRLLKIHKREESQISCRLISASLENPPPYIAILGEFAVTSYHHTKISLRVDDKSYDVPIEIAHILERFSSQSDQTMALWIDALCINHNNPEALSKELEIVPKVHLKATKSLPPCDMESGANDAVVYRQTNDLDIASNIFVCKYVRNVFTLWKATAGGMFSWQGITYLTTIAHGFPGSETVSTMPDARGELLQDHAESHEDSDENRSEYSIADDSNFDVDDEQLMDTTSRGSWTPQMMHSINSDETTASTENSGQTQHEASSDIVIHTVGQGMIISQAESLLGHDHPDILKASPTTASLSKRIYAGDLVHPALHLLPIGRFIESGLSSECLDYNLIQVKPSLSRRFNQITLDLDYKTTIIYPHRVAGTLLDTNVLAVTGSTGVMTGRLCGTPTFVQVNARSQELWTVRLNGQLQLGDSGSLVVDVENGNILGHVISGSPGTGVAYIVPMYQILDDISKRLRFDLEVSTRQQVGNLSMKQHGATSQVTDSDVQNGRNILDFFTFSNSTATANSRGFYESRRRDDSSTLVNSNRSQITPVERKTLPEQQPSEPASDEIKNHRARELYDLASSKMRQLIYKLPIFAHKKNSQSVRQTTSPITKLKVEDFSSLWLSDVFVLAHRKGENDHPIPKVAMCTIDTGNMLGNLVSREFAVQELGLLDSDFRVLSEHERRGTLGIAGQRNVPESAVYLTWYHKQGARILHNMRFLVVPSLQADLVLGASSISKHRLLEEHM
ncbi:PNG1- with de-N-glycosylation function (N-glycanase) protein [Rutstroemia sp. NJR-2017a BVV2]|nr:PNG1- with de-N-glycosylation function (N-glycanase) protein [Rutstroemia sp. NJR-2017a BVV2]